VTGRVTAHVYVTAKDGSRRGWLQPGDEVPGWARVDERLLESGDSVESSQGPAGASGQGPLTEPPRSGKGSGAEAWQRYAQARGVQTDSDMSRDDIIAAVDAADGTSAKE
jgi:hypothetical protein